MNLAQVIDFETGHYLPNTWKCARYTFTAPPPGPVAIPVHYTPASKRVLEVLARSTRPMTIIELANLLKMPRFTVYDCVMSVDAIEHTGMRGREKCYWVRK